MAQKGIIINTNTAGHVDASDFAKLIKGLGSDEAYILDTGDNLIITKESDNEVKITAGMIVMSNGIPIRIEDEESINIPSGTLGYKRYSLVIAEYKKDGVEVGTDSCTIKVINGDSVVNNPVKPTLTKSDTLVQDEICAVLVDGITADIENKIDVAGVKNTSKNTSNENLLINPDFSLNQRGLTTYTAVTTKAVYTVDCWRMSLTNGCKTTVNDDGTVTFTVTMDDYSVSLLQEVENYDINDVYTFSVKFKDDDKVYSLTNQTGEGFDKVIKGSISLKLLESTNGNVIAAITQSGAGSYTLEWAKLEIGNQATKFAKPLASDNLLRCKRYYQRISGGICTGSHVNSSYAVGVIRFNEMRTIPTYNLVGTLNLNIPNIWGVDIKSLSNRVTPTDTSLSLGFNYASSKSATIGVSGIITSNANSYIELDAGLY